MSVNEKLKKYQTLFACLGLRPIITRNKIKGECIPKDILKRILYFIPSLSFIVINLLQVFVKWTLIDDNDYGHLQSFILNAYYYIVAFSNITAHIQCLMYKRIYTDMMQQIASVQHLFAFKCERDINFKKFANSFRFKFFISWFYLFAVGISTYFINAESSSSALILTIITIVLEIISSMSCMHAIFLIDLVHMMTKEISQTLIHTKSYFRSSADVEGRVKNLLKIKSLHFEIWNIVQQINIFFGWSFITLIIKYLVDILYDLYWIFIDIEQFSWEGASNFVTIIYLSAATTNLMFLINSCQYCSSEPSTLLGNVVKYVSFTSDNISIYAHKHDTLAQIRDLPFQILAGGFFNIDRKYLAAVVCTICTYMIICIQFYLASDQHKPQKTSDEQKAQKSECI